MDKENSTKTEEIRTAFFLSLLHNRHAVVKKRVITISCENHQEVEKEKKNRIYIIRERFTELFLFLFRSLLYARYGLWCKLTRRSHVCAGHAGDSRVYN